MTRITIGALVTAGLLTSRGLLMALGLEAERSIGTIGDQLNTTLLKAVFASR